MDPLFWILSGVVGVCLVGIIVLWLLERQATRQLAQQEEGRTSAQLKAIDPRAVLEEIDTRPLPTTPPHPPQRLKRREPPAPPAPPAEMPTFDSRPGHPDNAEAHKPEALPFPTIHIAQPPLAASASPAGQTSKPPLDAKSPAPPAVSSHLLTSREERAFSTANASGQTRTDPKEPAPQASAPGEADEKGADEKEPVEHAPVAPASVPQKHLHTTPARAMLRAAELARERHTLEQVLEAHQARLEALLQHNQPRSQEDAASISLLQSEITRQREHLQEILFLEQNYRQIAASLSEQLAQQRPVSPDTPRAFGARRHSLARVQPPGQGQSNPNPSHPTES